MYIVEFTSISSKEKRKMFIRDYETARWISSQGINAKITKV